MIVSMGHDDWGRQLDRILTDLGIKNVGNEKPRRSVRPVAAVVAVAGILATLMLAPSGWAAVCAVGSALAVLVLARR